MLDFKTKTDGFDLAMIKHDIRPQPVQKSQQKWLEKGGRQGIIEACLAKKHILQYVMAMR